MNDERPITHRYEDPVDQVWRVAAARIGLKLARSEDVFASTDGRGTLYLGVPGSLDADDSLAQMVLHELCHALVEGPESLDRVDWGLDGSRPEPAREHACLRVQAWLARQYGLGRILAPTTEHRAFYDRLGNTPLAPRSDRVVQAARRAATRVDREPFGPHLREALASTASIARAASAGASPDSLWSLLDEPTPKHPTGLPLGAEGRCGECVWQRPAGPGKPVPRCRQANEQRVDVGWPGCERFEASLDCQDCGACCREAYQTVEVARRDPVRKSHPELLGEKDGRLHLLRAGDRCAALDGDGLPEDRYRCVIYAKRPQTCRDFTRGSQNCRDARAKVGL